MPAEIVGVFYAATAAVAGVLVVLDVLDAADREEAMRHVTTRCPACGRTTDRHEDGAWFCDCGAVF